MSTFPPPADSSGEPAGNPWLEMSERAKQVAKTIEEKVRKVSTPPEGTPLLDATDPTEEIPPLTDEAPPIP